MGVWTPKKLVVVEPQKCLQFCDSKGIGVHRVGHDGSNHEALVQRSAPANGDSTLLSSLSWCVGIAVDTKAGKIYWTQKGLSKSLRSGIFRSGIGIPSGQTASIQSDIELLFDNLPESIDPEIDFETRTLYWTDRDEHPKGYSLNQAFVGNNKGMPEILAHRVETQLGALSSSCE